MSRYECTMTISKPILVGFHVVMISGKQEYNTTGIGNILIIIDDQHSVKVMELDTKDNNHINNFFMTQTFFYSCLRKRSTFSKLKSLKENIFQ